MSLHGARAGRKGPQGTVDQTRLQRPIGEVTVVFRHACKLGLEGIVSKRKDSPYRNGRSPDWLKMKNPACAAVEREAEEDWGR
jgi:ATP-dependent DNA ligase